METEWNIKDGKILPKKRGFNFIYWAPKISRITYTSMMEAGMQDLADLIVSRRRRSIVTSNYIWEDLSMYAKTTPKKEIVNISIYSACLDKLRDTLKVDEKLRPLSLDDARDVIPQYAAAGLPYINRYQKLKKVDVVKRFYPEIKNEWDEIARGCPHVIPDSTAFCRSDIVKPGDNKCRAIWSAPVSLLLQEARFSHPLTQAIVNQKCCLNTTYGCELMRGGMTWINQQGKKANLLHGKCKYFVILYSEFESMIPAWLILDVFMIILEKFECTEYDRVCYRRIVDYLINTPIQISDGRRFQKAHGMPNATMFSNLIATFTNMVISWYCCWIVFHTKPIFDIYFESDNLICLPHTTVLDVDAYARTMKYYFGIVISPTRSYWTSSLNNISFLGYYNYCGSPYKDPISLIAKVLLPSREDNWHKCVGTSLDTLLTSGGVSVDVFFAFRSIFIKAEQFGINIKNAIQSLKTRHRSDRFTKTMGLEDKISKKFFTDINMSVPSLDCLKIQLKISLL